MMTLAHTAFLAAALADNSSSSVQFMPASTTADPASTPAPVSSTTTSSIQYWANAHCEKPGSSVTNPCGEKVHDVVSTIPSAFTNDEPTLWSFTTPGGKKVCRSEWAFIPGDAHDPARFQHTSCVDPDDPDLIDEDECQERLVSAQCERLTREGHLDDGDCRKYKKFLDGEQSDCDYLFLRLKAYSFNSHKFVVKPSFNGNSDMSFLKVMKNQDRDTLQMSEFYEDVTRKAEEFNTTHLLQQQEYVSDKHFSAEMALGQRFNKSNPKASYSIKDVYRMVTDTIRAFATFHCAGYLHGDAHGNNILFVNTNKVKIIDFDLVAHLNNTTTGEKNTNWPKEEHNIRVHINFILDFIPRARSESAWKWEVKTRLFQKMLNKPDALFPSRRPNSPEDIPYCRNTTLLTVEGLFHFSEGEKFEDDEAWPDVSGFPPRGLGPMEGVWYVNQTQWVRTGV